MIVGAKSDLENERKVPLFEGQLFANNVECPFIETSSKTGINIKKAVKLLLCEINKQENNFDKKKIPFYDITESFIQNKFYRFMEFILLLLCFSCGLEEMVLGYQAGVKVRMDDNEQYPTSFYIFILFIAIWSILMSILGFIGIKKEKHEFLKYNEFGNYFLSIFIFGRVVSPFAFLQNIDINESMSLGFLIGQFIISLVLCFFDFIFCNIYKNNLRLYIA